MKLKVILILIVTQIINEGFCESGRFTVVGSQLLRFRQKYSASVEYSGYNDERELEINLSATNSDFKLSKQMTLSDSGIENVDFNVSNVGIFPIFVNKKFNNHHMKSFEQLKGQPKGDYVLSIKSGNFEASRKLYMSRKKASIFIQTDKAVYKPSDLVRFRVLILDADTKPLKGLSKVKVFITDGADNTVKEFDEDVRFTKGVYQDKLKLSESPVKGEWKINVEVNGEKNSKSFDVAEYVLPKFELSIETAPDVTLKDEKIRATVKAMYTFGKAVQGSANIKASVDGKELISKDIEVDGKSSITFDMNDELDLKDGSRDYSVKFDATLKEEMTGKTVKATPSIVKVHSAPYKVDLQCKNEIKPGLPYKITAFIRNHNRNLPVMNDKNNPVTFFVQYYLGDLKDEDKNEELDETDNDNDQEESISNENEENDKSEDSNEESDENSGEESDEENDDSNEESDEENDDSNEESNEENDDSNEESEQSEEKDDGGQEIDEGQEIENGKFKFEVYINNGIAEINIKVPSNVAKLDIQVIF